MCNRPTPENIIQQFCDSTKSLQELFVSDKLASFIDYEVKKMSGMCFIGVNVRTDSVNEDIKPIDINNFGYDTKASLSDIGGNIPMLLSKLGGDVREISFTYEQDGNSATLGEICPDNHRNAIVDFFQNTKSDFCGEDEESFNFVSKIVSDYLQKTKSGKNENKNKFYVWVFAGDFDVRNEGKPLSYILVVSNDKSDYDKIIKEKRRTLIEFIMLAKARKLKEIDDQRIREAIKSAKAAIMARNLSHNLGSHVMSYMKQDLSSVEDMISRRVLEDAYSKKNFPSGDVELPYLVGIGKFISYLQERQDYIATVSTDYIPYPSAVNFKDAIYDELNPDYRFQRHSEWKGHKPTNILLENIAKSEGLSRENGTQKGNNIIIKYGKFDGLNHYGDGKEDYEKLRQWNFSLPGGIMGRHAVFSIVENVIRNAAKHSSRTQDENLTLTFDIKDPVLEKGSWKDDPFFRDYLNKEDTSDLYVVTLTDSANTEEERINFINRIVCDPFANDGEDLTASNKGLKEMVISAAWLRNIRIEEENIDSNKVPILRARSVEGHLQYVFCLPKVKEVALITSNEKLLNAAKSDLWKQNGWYAYSVEDYKKLSSKNFNFILLDNNPDSRKDEIRKCSNNRFFVAANETNLKQGEIHLDMSKCGGYNSDDDFRKTEEDLFQQLANLNGEKVEIAISDGGEVNTGNCGYVCAMPDEQDIEGKEYIYRKHNDTETEFLGFLANISGCNTNNLMPALNKVKFIEGITGGNSTDRLIRRNVRDEKWFYQHLHAMNTKVAIFDERLFTKISGYEMSQLHEGKKEVINWEDKLRDKNDTDSRNYFSKYDRDHSHKVKTTDLSNRKKEEIIELASTIYPYESPKSPCDLKRITPLVYEKKGISVFTWTRIEDEKFAIWGLKIDFSGVVADERNRKLKIGAYGQVEKIAELTIVHDESGIKPQVDFVGSRTYDFDYISIHQGLLDKIYEKVNPDGENKLAPEKKMAVTKAIHEKFAPSYDYAKADYLPGLAIHSGRSKPNAEDMPQHQPFIQYSAIENAVFDCKYTLVELLDFACYE